jgi:NAD(P)-dependent dehydrogenase (short-subunit alcohol dehydrogenase family)
MRAVLMTGANGGIGSATVERLAASGWRVFAGVRDLAAGQALARRVGGEVTPVALDVTDEASIAAAAGALRERLGDRGLHGLVNNAGIVVEGPAEMLTTAELRRQFEVNVIGPTAVTRAVLPHLRRGRGRVVNVGAVTGRAAIPYLGASGASKAALAAFSDVLRVELRPFEIAVSLVEPAPIATSILDKAAREADGARPQIDPAVRDLYAPGVAAMRRAVADGDVSSADVVARAIARALSARRPRTRYLVGRRARGLALLPRLPDRARDAILVRELGLREL